MVNFKNKRRSIIYRLKGLISSLGFLNLQLSIMMTVEQKNRKTCKYNIDNEQQLEQLVYKTTVPGGGYH